MGRRLPVVAVIVSVWVAWACAAGERRLPQPAVVPAKSFAEGLADALDRYHRRFDVYSDADAGGNHFAVRACMGPTPRFCAERPDAMPPMDERAACPARPGTCIRARAHLRGTEWGGWYLQNGVLRPGRAVPDQNWGDVANAGVDLRGATTLTFDVAGRDGNERVEFFAFGIGYDADTGARTARFPESARKVSRGYIVLTRSFQRVSIPLQGDLRNVLGGFGWATSALRNGNQDIEFYIDNISFNKARLLEPRLPLSFVEQGASAVPIDVVLTNTAFTYDAAAALVAFVAAGDLPRARVIADALVDVQTADRAYQDYRVRNAYQAGDLLSPPGWPRAARMPGWYVPQPAEWREDRFQVGSHTGNVAWAMLGLLSYVEATATSLPAAGRAKYVDAIVRLGSWVEDHCRDPRSGYRGGYDGWEPSAPPSGADARSGFVVFRATEHNLDLVSAFERLAVVTGDTRWAARAEHARRFVEEMWDETGKFFRTGTKGEPGRDAEVNTAVVPLDAQSWSVLALGTRGAKYWAPALAYAERLRVGDGFAFSTASSDGIWYEGTAQMAVAYRLAGRSGDADALVQLLMDARLPSGTVPASSIDGLKTGFDAVPGIEWKYYRWGHTGATAWAVLAARGVNPFAPFSPATRDSR